MHTHVERERQRHRQRGGERGERERESQRERHTERDQHKLAWFLCRVFYTGYLIFISLLSKSVQIVFTW